MVKEDGNENGIENGKENENEKGDENWNGDENGNGDGQVERGLEHLRLEIDISDE